MTKGDLVPTGKKLGLLGAVIAFIMLALGAIGFVSPVIDFTLLDNILSTDQLLGIAIRLFLTFILYFASTDQINIGELFLLGFVILILGLLIGGVGGLFAAFGGVLIILEAIF